MGALSQDPLYFRHIASHNFGGGKGIFSGDGIINLGISAYGSDGLLT